LAHSAENMVLRIIARRIIMTAKDNLDGGH